MATQFTLYALEPRQVPLAQRYASSSLGYGNTDINSVIAAATMPMEYRMEIFLSEDPDRLVVGDHVTFCGYPEEECSPHEILSAIREPERCPVIDERMADRVYETTKDQGLRDWLVASSGKHIWYVFE